MQTRRPVLLSLPTCQPFACFLIVREIFALSNGNDFDQDFLVDDPVHDTDRFLRCVEFVVAGEIEAGAIAKMFAQPWGGVEFPELLRNRCFGRSVKLSNVLGCCDGQDDALSHTSLLLPR